MSKQNPVPRKNEVILVSFVYSWMSNESPMTEAPELHTFKCLYEEWLQLQKILEEVDYIIDTDDFNGEDEAFFNELLERENDPDVLGMPTWFSSISVFVNCDEGFRNDESSIIIKEPQRIQ